MSTMMAAASTGAAAGMSDANEKDAYFADAARLLMDKDKGSIGMLQRYFKIGFNRAARIMDQLRRSWCGRSGRGNKAKKSLNESGTI